LPLARLLLVDVRRLDLGAAVAEVGVARIIGHDEEDIGFRARRVGEGMTEPADAEERQTIEEWSMISAAVTSSLCLPSRVGP
jgi:hypothetical protein